MSLVPEKAAAFLYHDYTWFHLCMVEFLKCIFEYSYRSVPEHRQKFSLKNCVCFSCTTTIVPHHTAQRSWPRFSLFFLTILCTVDNKILKLLGILCLEIYSLIVALFACPNPGEQERKHFGASCVTKRGLCFLNMSVFFIAMSYMHWAQTLVSPQSNDGFEKTSSYLFQYLNLKSCFGCLLTWSVSGKFVGKDRFSSSNFLCYYTNLLL